MSGSAQSRTPLPPLPSSITGWRGLQHRASPLPAGLSLTPGVHLVPTRCVPGLIGSTPDSFKDGEPIVALSRNIWFSRLNRLGDEDIFAVDKRDLVNNGSDDRSFALQDHLVSRFAQWLGVHTVMPTAKLLNPSRDFMVLDDRHGPWLRFIR